MHRMVQNKHSYPRKEGQGIASEQPTPSQNQHLVGRPTNLTVWCLASGSYNKIFWGSKVLDSPILPALLLTFDRVFLLGLGQLHSTPVDLLGGHSTALASPEFCLVVV